MDKIKVDVEVALIKMCYRGTKVKTQFIDGKYFIDVIIDLIITCNMIEIIERLNIRFSYMRPRDNKIILTFIKEV